MQPRIFVQGYNALTDRRGIHPESLMDIGVYVFSPGEKFTFRAERDESAFLLLDGEVSFEWNGLSESASRHSVFDAPPTALHVSSHVDVAITAKSSAEVLIQKTDNPRAFEPVFYPSSSIKNVFLGADNMQGCAKRVLRDIFNYGNASYSNMVLGEDLHLPGRWSSYPPHHHPQPEVYYYRFDKPQGFGVTIVGDDATVIKHNHICVIPGGECHPQAAAPGYAMYYTWMIRHLDGNPWTDRIDDPKHVWLHDKDAIIWNGPARA
ncbi:MAG: 5-deoxy-glucuronate isomerase [Synergistaceae bacterium]|jgi:5-deoxy-glucuronate isomerase|nr:5-deoxy-glucuronate isomerase [Synergistaceae bacterium]